MSGDGGDTGAAVDQAAFLRRCCALFVDRGDGRRLVLFIDDAHLLDDASATLIHRLAETGSAFVLATVRTGEPPPDAVAALWKDELAERIDVAALPVDAVETPRRTERRSCHEAVAGRVHFASTQPAELRPHEGP